MKDYRNGNTAAAPPQQSGRWFLSFGFILATALGICAQSPTDTDAAMKRVARARALAASHNLVAATTELDQIITSTTDDAIRDVARIMLMNIYIEEANYTKADALLTETFQARSSQKESSIRSYFALAGQTINGARAHMERYRTFGINVSDTGLPPEAVNDLDKLRLLLELVVEQAREINKEGAKRPDAAALLEDAAGVRTALARSEQDRQQWQREIALARESLAATETRITSIAKNSTPTPPQTSAPNTRSSGANRTVTPPAQASSPGPSNINPESRPATPALAQRQNDAHGSTQGAGAVANAARLTNVGSLVERATQKVSPSYPQIARNAHVSGIVRVYLEIDETGTVVTVQRTDGPQLLRQAAADAARKWKFKPTLVDGQPVRVSGFINFNFTL